MYASPERIVSVKPEDRLAFELEFISEYRGAALHWARYAALSAAILFAVFMLVAWLAESVSVSTQLVRGSLCFAGLLIFFSLSRGWVITGENYVRLIGFGAVCGLVGAVVVPILPVEGGNDFVPRASPAIVCGLFVMYSFLRLPVVVAAGIGASTSALAVVWAPLVEGGSESLRTLVYLLFTNVVGIAISRLIESRERELFMKRRIAHLALQEAGIKQRYAEAAEHEKDQLIAAISHDLKQPMMAASAHLDVMQLRLEGGDLVGARDQACKATEAVRVLDLTLDQLLVAARCQEGVEEVTIKNVNLAKLLNEVLEPVWIQADRLGVDVQVRLPIGEICIDTDPGLFRRVVSNVIVNAVKFTQREDGGRQSVLLAVRARAEYCRIDVFDTGVGIAPDRINDVWKPFVQLGNHGRDRERGLGLGLFLVRRIIERLPHHTASIRSQLGRGTCFTVNVPLADSSRRVQESVAVRASWSKVWLDHDLSGTRVLVLEDDRSARVALVDLLESFGATVVSGATVTDLLAGQDGDKQQADVIVCDYQLGDGATAAEGLQRLCMSLGCALPAVVVTGAPDVDSVRARLGHDVRVLQKPFAAAELASRLRSALVSRQKPLGSL
jgi:signal transduction histidine kinase/CheY-like chemotaxis protein